MIEMDFAQSQKLRELLANWSDKNLRDARAFVESRKELISSRDLANSQLYGFLNVVRNVTETDDIKNFILNQALKAARAGKSKEKMHEFWLALQSRCEMVWTDAANIAREVNQFWVNDPKQTAMMYILRQLLQKYLQHVIAEKLVLEKQTMKSKLQ